MKKLITLLTVATIICAFSCVSFAKGSIYTDCNYSDSILGGTEKAGFGVTSSGDICSGNVTAEVWDDADYGKYKINVSTVYNGKVNLNGINCP